MPLPSPKGKEEQDAFVSRCMGDETMKKEYKNNKQRLAVCFSQFKRAKKRAKGSEVKWEDGDARAIL
jgi:hypothetical protein